VSFGIKPPMRTVTPLKQPTRTSCGQTAMAMIAGCSLAHVRKAYGHMSTTYGFEHIPAGRKLWLDVQIAVKLDVVNLDEARRVLPRNALVRIVRLKHSGGHTSTNGKTKLTGHMIAYIDGNFYDPDTGAEKTELGPLEVVDHYLAVGPRIVNAL
jgi:hypothetical protein